VISELLIGKDVEGNCRGNLEIGLLSKNFLVRTEKRKRKPSVRIAGFRPEI
jgi:hypothetical protein